MALSNTAPSESRGLTKRKGGSPISSSLTDVTASNSAEPQDTRLGASTQRTLMNLELQQFPKAPVREGAKEATTHDFLSLYKNAAVTGKIETAAAQGMVPPSVTQELLQPLEKCTQPTGGNIIAPGLVNSKGHMNHYRGTGTNTSCYGGVQGASYVQSNGVRELPPKSMWMDGVEGALNGVKERLDDCAHWSTNQLKFGNLDLGYVAKTGSTYSHLEVGQHHTSSLNKQWQQLGSEFCNIVKEPLRVTSKGNKDEEYSECNNQSEKKDVLIQKGDILQKMDVKTSDCKSSTPRSKHSATEQRRRSKINDRFQMLRQLVPNTDQKRDKASFLLEVIDYIQVLQEKLRKYDATEHGWQQERLKTITWDSPQRNSGLQDFMPIVSTVPFDLKKATDNILGRSRSTSVAAPGEHGSIGDVSLPVDTAIEDSQFGPPNHGKVSITKSTPVSLSTQLPVHIPNGKGSHLANISVLQSVPESHMSSHSRPDDEKVVPLSINKVDAALPVPYENNRPLARRIFDIDEKLHDELKDKEREFSRQDASGEACNEDLANGKGNSGLEMEPSVAGSSLGLLPSKDACVSKHRSGVNNAIIHRPESPRKGETFTSLQEPMIVQGDDVNVSSLYSQKLLDMLTRELQCSGLDLSKTSISVQINLGKAANQTGEIQQQSEGNRKHPASQELEHFSKRPKIESKS